jgi:Flp pilus assembly protein TadD
MTAAADRAVAAALAAAARALDRGDLRAADDAFAAAARRAPRDAAIALARANVARLTGDATAARTILTAAVADTDWTDATTAHELGTALLAVGGVRDAVRCFRHVTAQRPHDPAPPAALAAALRLAGRATEGWEALQPALAVPAPPAAVFVTAAQIRHDLADDAGAAAWFRRAHAARPDHAPTRVQEAYTRFMAGDMATGWRLYESRPLPEPTGDARPWREEPLDGATITVLAEQGVGDQFQFLRFVPLLYARGAAHVVVEAHAAAVPLLRAAGFDAVPRGADVTTTWFVPLLSLPLRLGLPDATLAERVPYLQLADAPPRAERAAPSAEHRRLGLVWAGNPDFPGRETRDLDPALLPGLASFPGVRWQPLQQGDAAQLAPAAIGSAEPLADWLATARALLALDGLVTTDTGIAHLAGALGVRTWVLLQHVPDWRWGRHGTRSAWYPSLTLVRQPAPGDWAGALEALRAALAAD